MQIAAADLLRLAAPIRDAIHARVRTNLDRARAIVANYPACELLRVEGGWAAPIRVPATHSEEDLVLKLVREARVLVHPGYFFDFPHEAFLVLSLLPECTEFAEGLERALQMANS